MDQGKQSEGCLHRVREFILRIGLKGQDLGSGNDFPGLIAGEISNEDNRVSGLTIIPHGGCSEDFITREILQHHPLAEQ